jgi:hypothetical protein
VHQGMPVDRAETICRVVTDTDLNQNCVFDVTSTGDELFAQAYVFAQQLRLYSTAVKIACHPAPTRQPYLPPNVKADVTAQQKDHSVAVIATVLPLTPGRPTPTGTVTVLIDGVAASPPTQLDDGGWARVALAALKPGEHKIRATYSGGGSFNYHSSSSPTLLYTVPA